MPDYQARNFEEHVTLSRTEIAERLRALADQIAQGTISLGPVQSPMGDRADYEVDFDVDHHKRELKIEIEWR